MTAPIIHPVVEDESRRLFRETVVPALRAALGDKVFDSWFGRLELRDITDGVARLTVPTNFLRSWIQAHYLDRLVAVLAKTFAGLTRVDITVRSSSCARGMSPVAAVRSAPAAEPIPSPPPQPAPTESRKPVEQETTFQASPLDARHTFRTFIVGRTNELAFSAARTIATASGDRPVFNPLFVHAACGLGKTHLLQAIAAAATEAGRRVLYLTAERFMYGFVVALRAQSLHELKKELRRIDVLIIDDVQFLQGKSIQQEFRHAVSACLDEGRQLVLAADRMPSDLESLDDHVRSRLSGGLAVEIAAPDFETRLAMVTALAVSAATLEPGFVLPPDVAGYVAEVIQTNGRDLAGAVNRLVASASLGGGAGLTVEIAALAIRDLVRTREPKRVRIEDIQKLVASHFNVSRADILSSRRTANVVRPRQVAMYLAKIMTLRSLPEIGRRFGGRDHTTILHAIRKIEGLVASDRSLSDEIGNMKRMLEDG